MSEVIITAEMKEDAKKCNGSMACGVCKMPREFHLHPQMCIETLASLPGVWDGTDNPLAVSAIVNYYNSENRGVGSSKEYERTLPKSLIEELSEKYAKEIDTEPLIVKLVQNKLVEMLKEYNERQGK